MQVPPGSLVAGLPAVVKGEVSASLLQRLGASEQVAREDIAPELAGLPGVSFARKYRRVAEAYSGGRNFRPNAGMD
jgi:hypothetical protein